MKLPHMPLWVYDIESDEACALMTHEQFGVYIRLLIRQWIEGSIPADPQRLAMLIREPSERFSERFSDVLAKFDQHPEKPGRLINGRLHTERAKAVDKVEKNRIAGRKGGLSKEANALADAKANAAIRASDSEYISESSSGGVQGGNAEPDLSPTLDTPDFRQAWADWYEYRRQAKLKKYTAMGAKKQLKRMEAIGHDAAIKAIEHSIAQQYHGIHEGGGGKAVAGQGGARRTARQIEADRGEFDEDIQLRVTRVTG